MGQGARVLRFCKGGESGSGAEDVKRQIDNNEGKQKPIYELVNVKNGGGKLIDIIKSSARISNGSFNQSNSSETDLNDQACLQPEQLDKKIYDLVKPFLYNEGKGKLIPLKEIWRLRLSRQEDDEASLNENSKNDIGCSESEKDPHKYRWVCWKLEERGFVGETGLHICFLLSTPTHMILAKKLLKLFPMLINDIYTCDQYFGESSLVSKR